MSVFNDETREYKPNYEKRIAHLKNLSAVTSRFYASLLDYIDLQQIYITQRDFRFTLTELLGSLDLEIRKQQKQIAVYMEKMKENEEEQS